MARQYTNIIEFMAPHNYSFLMTKEEYIGSDKKTLPIQCPEKHVFTMTFDSFRNKRLIYTKKALDMKSFCSTCSLSDQKVNTKKFKAVIRDGYKLRVILMYENGEVQEDLLFEKESDVDVMEEMKFREKGRRY